MNAKHASNCSYHSICLTTLMFKDKRRTKWTTSTLLRFPITITAAAFLSPEQFRCCQKFMNGNKPKKGNNVAQNNIKKKYI